MKLLTPTHNGQYVASALGLLGTFGRIGRTAITLTIVAAVAMSPTRTLGQFDLSEIGYDGFAEAVDDIMVSAYESGRVDAVMVKVGDRVKAGQVIAMLDQTPQRIAVEAAETVAGMRGGLDLATADQALHDLRFRQLKVLAANGNARPEEVDRAAAEFEMSAARFVNAKEEVARREFELKQAQEQFRRRQVISPVDGVVAKLLVDIGEYVLPSDLTVVRIINTSELKAVFNVPAAEAVRMSIGQAVRVEFTGIARSAEGAIDTISPMIDADSGTISIAVRIDNSSQRWMAGDRCLLDVVSRPKPNRTSAVVPEISVVEKLSPSIDVRPQATNDTVSASKDKVSVVVSGGSVRITDLPTRSAAISSGDETNR